MTYQSGEPTLLTILRNFIRQHRKLTKFIEDKLWQIIELARRAVTGHTVEIKYRAELGNEPRIIVTTGQTINVKVQVTPRQAETPANRLLLSLCGLDLVYPHSLLVQEFIIHFSNVLANYSPFSNATMLANMLGQQWLVNRLATVAVWPSNFFPIPALGSRRDVDALLDTFTVEVNGTVLNRNQLDIVKEVLYGAVYVRAMLEPSSSIHSLVDVAALHYVVAELLDQHVKHPRLLFAILDEIEQTMNVLEEAFLTFDEVLAWRLAYRLDKFARVLARYV